MKKSSILVTLFLVLALIFAVSCPDNSPALKVTSPTKTDAAVSATVGTEKEIPIKLELANDAFVATTVKKDADLKDWFTLLSDGTTTAKAEKVSALVSKVSAAESTTKADGDAKLVIAELTLKVNPTVPTEADKPVTVAIKVPAEKNNVKYTESGKEITAADNDIKITITAAAKSDVTAKVGGDAAVFNAGTADTTGKKVTVTLDGGTFAKKDGINVSAPNGATAAHLTYTYDIDASDKKVLIITVKATREIAAADKGTYKINIPASAITADGTHTAKDITKDLQVTVKAPVSNPTVAGDVSFNTTTADPKGKKVKITVANAKFVAEKISTITAKKPNGATEGHIKFSSFTAVSGSETSVEATVTCTGDVVAADAGDWTITIPADAISAVGDYFVPEVGLILTKTVSVS